MSDILLKRAEADLHLADMCLQSGDEYLIQLAAFHVEQCVEKSLIYAVRWSGLECPIVHDITLLVNMLPTLQTCIPRVTLNMVCYHSHILTAFESVTRGDSEYMASRSLVEDLYKLATTLFTQVSFNCKRLGDQAS